MAISQVKTLNPKCNPVPSEWQDEMRGGIGAHRYRRGGGGPGDKASCLWAGRSTPQASSSSCCLRHGRGGGVLALAVAIEKWLHRKGRSRRRDGGCHRLTLNHNQRQQVRSAEEGRQASQDVSLSLSDRAGERDARRQFRRAAGNEAGRADGRGARGSRTGFAYRQHSSAILSFERARGFRLGDAALRLSFHWPGAREGVTAGRCDAGRAGGGEDAAAGWSPPSAGPRGGVTAVAAALRGIGSVGQTGLTQWFQHHRHNGLLLLPAWQTGREGPSYTPCRSGGGGDLCYPFPPFSVPPPGSGARGFSPSDCLLVLFPEARASGAYAARRRSETAQVQ
ncbi:hypothetical protein SKAU_G00130080 [Synaphobranchus kaupii]|uniref:Uncharacterized protein n=1 Tax=Synaphobranchus kaupii TaxID=118154 RepID=A0A9Q1FQC4_SYNKA|nr:hypothetical protein SKAU_G00130080 [Synaphobranchus kaupii]